MTIKIMFWWRRHKTKQYKQKFEMIYFLSYQLLTAIGLVDLIKGFNQIYPMVIYLQQIRP